jgi:glycosyltransferase involved in cell wall biosynthesis
MNQLAVSVVIPNYNYGRFLSEAVESVLAQTYPCHEIIVVDDGSTDESLEILAKYEGKVRVIEQKNCGVGIARNTGVENSTGDLIAFLDADDHWEKDKIERQIQQFLEDQEVGLVSCGMREFDRQGEILHHYLSDQKGWIAEKIVAFNVEIVVSGSAIVVRRDIFERAGGFDERKELHPSEDWEFFYRVASISKIAFVPELLVNYRNHGSNGHLKIPQMERAMFLAFKKIYTDAPAEIQKLKGKSYGNLYSVLAGCYFYAGNYTDFVRTTAKSLRYKPSQITRFLAFPLRFLQRRKRAPK